MTWRATSARPYEMAWLMESIAEEGLREPIDVLEAGPYTRPLFGST